MHCGHYAAQVLLVFYGSASSGLHNSDFCSDIWSWLIFLVTCCDMCSACTVNLDRLTIVRGRIKMIMQKKMGGLLPLVIFSFCFLFLVVKHLMLHLKGSVSLNCIITSFSCYCENEADWLWNPKTNSRHYELVWKCRRVILMHCNVRRIQFDNVLE